MGLTNLDTVPEWHVQPVSVLSVIPDWYESASIVDRDSAIRVLSETDEAQMTNVPGVFAAGAVLMGKSLVNAAREGEAAMMKLGVMELNLLIFHQHDLEQTLLQNL